MRLHQNNLTTGQGGQPCVAERLRNGLANKELSENQALQIFRSTSEAELLKTDPWGDNAYHVLLQLGVRIGLLCQTDRVIKSKNKDGSTLFHELITKGESVSPTCMDSYTLFMRDKQGNTPFIMMADNGLLAQVPRELLTIEHLTQANLLGETALQAALRNSFDLIPKEYLTVDLLLEADTNGYSGFHALAQGSALGKLPAGILKSDHLVLADKTGTTPLHWAAKRDLSQIPTGLVSPAAFLLRNYADVTPLHWAATSSQLNRVPLEVLTPDNLDIECSIDGDSTDGDNSTPLALAVVNDCSRQLPVFGRDALVFVRNLAEIEQEKWRKLLRNHKIELPESLKADLTYLGKKGAWQEL